MTTKIFILILCILLTSSLASAISISQDKETKINHGDISYYFPANSGVSEVELSSTGIIIDGNKLITIIQGGELEITLTSWSEEQGFSMVVSSSVPQTILYKYVIDGNKYYVQTNDSIFVDTFDIEDKLDLRLIQESSEEINIPTAYTEKLPSWGKRNAFFVVIDDQNAFFVKNSQILTIIIVFLVVFIGILLWRRK